MGAVRVLVVDDDARSLEATSTMLELSGFEVRGAQNGALGLEEVLRFRPEVIVFDFWMPVSDGRELLQGIREVFRERVGLVAMSGTPEVEDWCGRVGVSHFIRKPFEKSALVEAVNRAIEEARASSSRMVSSSPSPSQRRLAASRAVMLVGQLDLMSSVTRLLRETERPMVVACVPRMEDVRRALESLMIDVIAVVGEPVPEDRASFAEMLADATTRGLPVIVDDRHDVEAPVASRISFVRNATADSLAEAIQVAAGVPRAAATRS
jgi:DNA-binding NtrC family response regulator